MPHQKILTQVYNVHMPLAPVADAFSGTVTTAPINLKNATSITYLVFWGVGTTGTTLITVEACDDTTPTNTTAIPFRYKRANSAVSTNVWGAVTAATTAGFTTTAGSNQIYAIEVDADALASSGRGYVRLKAVEAVDAALLGGIIECLNVTYPRDVHTSALT